MNKPDIRILSNMARTGGTLVSRCLGSMRHIALLSEIHPLGTDIFNPLQQARDWHGFNAPEEWRTHSPGFLCSIENISRHCEHDGKTLVIRDWAHLDYIGVPFLRSPGYESILAGTLSSKFRIIQCAIVRHPVDQWLSTVRLRVMQGHLDLDRFLHGCRLFAEHHAGTGFIRFEEFTADPEGQMRRLCDYLQTDFDPSFITRWQDYDRVTGDVSKSSRGSRFDHITPLKRLTAPDGLLEKFRNNADYRKAISLLGYENPV